MRGALGHWIVVRKGKIYRYEVITPFTWNASPRDAENKPDPYGEALTETSITEALSSEESRGVDVIRVIISFDPCLGCGVHIYIGGKVIKKRDWFLLLNASIFFLLLHMLTSY